MAKSLQKKWKWTYPTARCEVLTLTFTFLVGILPSSTLRTFVGGTSQKKSPCSQNEHSNYIGKNWFKVKSSNQAFRLPSACQVISFYFFTAFMLSKFSFGLVELVRIILDWSFCISPDDAFSKEKSFVIKKVAGYSLKIYVLWFNYVPKMVTA